MEFISPVELICARHLEYRAENGEPAYTSAELSGGRRIDFRLLRGTLNRAARVEYPQVRRAAAVDRAYVQAEMDAILLAILGTLPAPVFNPADSSGWSGAQWHPFAWAMRAQAAGFLTLAHRCGYSGLEMPFPHLHNTTSHLVFGDRTFPPLPQEMEGAAARLAQSAGIPLLGITVACTVDGRSLFTGATPAPDLRTGGAAFLDALAAAFAPS